MPRKLTTRLHDAVDEIGDVDPRNLSFSCEKEKGEKSCHKGDETAESIDPQFFHKTGPDAACCSKADSFTSRYRNRDRGVGEFEFAEEKSWKSRLHDHEASAS